MLTLDQPVRPPRSELSKERRAIGLLVSLLTLLWVGFLLHRSSRFAGSAVGGAFAIVGAVLMVLPTLAYSLAKHVASLKRIVTARFSIARLLSWHVYTSVVGAILAIVHTGHRFESDIGIGLTAVMLLSVLTGYVGRHLLLLLATDVREKERRLAALQSRFNEAIARPAAFVVTSSEIRNAPNESMARAPALAEAIAELEYAVRSQTRWKRWASGWLTLHIVLAIAFLLLLAVHIWAGIYFGLRWLD